MYVICKYCAILYKELEYPWSLQFIGTNPQDTQGWLYWKIITTINLGNIHYCSQIQNTVYVFFSQYVLLRYNDIQHYLHLRIQHNDLACVSHKEIQFSSVQLLSCVRLFATLWTAARQASLSITTPGVYPNSCPSSWQCHPTISSSVVPFSSCPQSFPASGSFQMSQLLSSGGQNIGVSASTSVLPMNTQDWFPLGWTGWISLQSKGLPRVFSNTTVQKHQFFGAQLSLYIVQLSHPYMTAGKTITLTRWTFVDKSNVSAFEYAV